MAHRQLPSNAPSPRVCLVKKDWPEQEYGYNLHAERGKGQFIGNVDAGSPADKAGLVAGDRIYAVNGVSIVNESHKQVTKFAYRIFCSVLSPPSRSLPEF